MYVYDNDPFKQVGGYREAQRFAKSTLPGHPELVPLAGDNLSGLPAISAGLPVAQAVREGRRLGIGGRSSGWRSRSTRSLTRAWAALGRSSSSTAR